jgi:hypothetical protein
MDVRLAFRSPPFEQWGGCVRLRCAVNKFHGVTEVTDR